MSEILKTINLSKNYPNKSVFREINIEVGMGKIVGLIGPNGSGKTTLMKIAAGLLRPSSGEISICGKKPGLETKSVVSYLPDGEFLFKWMKVKDAVNFYHDFYNDFDMVKANKLLETMKLKNNEAIPLLSKGMLEKLHLVLTLSRRAKLYILDEPLGGIDPLARDMIMNMIIDNFSQESSILISTHLVRDIEKIFDDVIFLSEGGIVLQGSAEELRMEKGMSMDELYREVFR